MKLRLIAATLAATSRDDSHHGRGFKRYALPNTFMIVAPKRIFGLYSTDQYKLANSCAQHGS